MDRENTGPTLIKIIGVVLIFIGVIGVVSGLYGLTLVKDYAGTALSTKDVSKTILDESLLLTRDKDNLEASLENTVEDISKASKGMDDASADILDTSLSIDKSSKNVGSAAESVSASANADKAASAKFVASADAMDLLWGPTNVANELRAAAAKIQESATKMEATSQNLRDTSINLRDASSQLKDSSGELKKVGADFNRSVESVGSAASSVDAMTSRLVNNLNDLVEGLQWLETRDKTTMLYQVIIYFMVIHMLFAAMGVALILISANLYGW